MKLVVAGSTGFVAAEVIKQALSHPGITSVVALGRKAVPAPASVPSSNQTRFQSVVCDNFEAYPENVKQQFAGADACIWTIAITPSRAMTHAWPEVVKTCRDYAITGLQTMSQLPRSDEAQRSKRPFRFVYFSGALAARDPAKKPWVRGEYSLMRGETESLILAHAQQSNGRIEACVAKPGLIDAPGKFGALARAAMAVGRATIGLPLVDVREVAAAVLEGVVKGFEKDTLENEDLRRVGREVLGREERVS